MKKKNSKKAFTLVELLAVIVILGILLLVAIPNVSKIIETSKKNSYLDATKMAVNAVMTEADLAKSGESEDEVFHFNGSGYCIFNFKDLDYSSGKVDGSGYVKVTKKTDGTYDYQIYSTNGELHISGVKFTDLNLEGIIDANGEYKTKTYYDGFESGSSCLNAETESVVAGTPATSTEVVYIKEWESYDVVFKDASGNILKMTKVIEGNPIPQFDPTPPSGKVFDKWNVVSGTYNVTEGVKGNLTLQVVWKDAGSGGSSSGTTSSKCPKYALLKFPNLDGGYEEFYVMDSGMSSNRLILLSKNGLIGSSGNVRQAESTGANTYAAGTFVLKHNSTEHDNYINNYKEYLTRMGLNVLSVNSFTVDTLSYYCNGVSAVCTTKSFYCYPEATSILDFGNNVWGEYNPCSSSGYAAYMTYFKSTNEARIFVSSSSTATYAVRPVVILNRSSVSQCN